MTIISIKSAGGPINVTTTPSELPEEVCTKQQSNVIYQLNNATQAPIKITSITGGFSDEKLFTFDDECSNLELAAGGTCNYTVVFESDTVSTGLSAKPVLSYADSTIPLPEWNFSAKDCAFVTASVKTDLPEKMAVHDSADVVFTFSNTSDTPATNVTVNFDTNTELSNINNQCQTTLNGQSSCEISATLTPKTEGQKTVSASFSYAESPDPVPISTQTTAIAVVLTGSTTTNLPQYTSSGQTYPVSFSFNNATDLPATQISVQASANLSDVAGSCTTSQTINANSSCEVTANFTPSVAATQQETATLTLSYQESPDNPVTASTNTIVDNTLLISAGENSTLLRSTDGNYWRTITDGIPADTILMGVTWGGDTTQQLVVTGTNGVILTSTDGITWASPSSGTTNELPAVTWSDDFKRYIAVGDSTILTSADGATWSSQTFPNGAGELDDLVCSNGQNQCMAVGQSGTIVTSSDGNTWVKANSGSQDMLTGIIWNAQKQQYLVVSNAGKLLSSMNNGKTWSKMTLPAGFSNVMGIAWSAKLNLYIAVGGAGGVISSADGTAWTTAAALPDAPDLNKVIWDDAIQSFLIAADNGKLFVSTDGKTWVPVTTSNTSANLKGLGKAMVTGKELKNTCKCEDDKETRSFPTEEQHRQAWENLAKNIASTQKMIQAGQASPLNLTTRPGELIILGSGIQSLNFIRGDEALIKRADKVFYCVADPSTVTWIKKLRPDAYDLYVLYGNHKVRYTTYMQMTEAMLYYVRQGKRVVAAYYGHPGVFALSPHRAILIARREGHKAIMKPGISALDCLCADLGVDPAHPGLQTHEATDLLIRQRILDTSLHIVLWQVGLIGDQSFRDQGYINDHFPILVEYLQKYYGKNYPITHYIASRYPTIPPLIETYTLNELYLPKVQLKINGISTFYLAPQRAAAPDSHMLQRLGLLKPGQSVKKEISPVREIGQYGPREMQAFHDFKRFKIPTSYHWQTNQKASDFLIHLHDDLELQSLYERNPVSAVCTFPGLTAVEQRLLASRNSNNIQAAAKGLVERSVDNEAFLQALITQQPLMHHFLKVVKQSPKQRLKQAMADWVTEKTGYRLKWSTLYKSWTRMLREKLALWTGIYCSKTPDYLITIQGSFKSLQPILQINGQIIRDYRFAHGVLEWPKQAGLTSGLLRLDINAQGRRRLIVSMSNDDQAPSMNHLFFSPEVFLNVPNNHLLAEKSWPHSLHPYEINIQGTFKKKHILIIHPHNIQIDHTRYSSSVVANCVTWQEKTGEYPQGNLIFFRDPITLTPALIGSVQNTTGKKLSCYGKSAPIHEPNRDLESLFGLSSEVALRLVTQCQQDRRYGYLHCFQTRKMQRGFRIIYTVLNPLTLRMLG